MNDAWWARGYESVVHSRRFRCLVHLGLLVIVLMLGYFLRLQETQATYRRGVVQAQTLEETHRAKAAEVAAREHLHEALARALARLQDARWYLSAGADMEDLLEHLAASGRNHGLMFERFEVETPVSEGDHLRLPLHMTVSGRYPALRLWLEEWGGQLRTLQVSSLSMSEVDGQKGQLQLRLTAQAFHAGEALPVPRSLADEPARLVLPTPRMNPFAPWSSRQPVDGLAGVPLEQLQMVGSLSRAGQTHAVLAFSGRLYRVAEGDRLGREEGIVTKADEERLEVQERLFVAGRWQKRSRYLVLHGHTSQGVMDEHKAAVGVGDGGQRVDGGGRKGL